MKPDSGRAPHQGDDCVDVVGRDRPLGKPVGALDAAALATVHHLPALFFVRESDRPHQTKASAAAVAGNGVIDMF